MRPVVLREVPWPLLIFTTQSFLRADGHNVQLYTEGAGAHIRDGKQKAVFSSQALYSYFASLLQELRGMRSAERKKVPLGCSAIFLTDTLQTISSP